MKYSCFSYHFCSSSSLSLSLFLILSLYIYIYIYIYILMFCFNEKKKKLYIHLPFSHSLAVFLSVFVCLSFLSLSIYLSINQSYCFDLQTSEENLIQLAKMWIGINRLLFLGKSDSTIK